MKDARAKRVNYGFSLSNMQMSYALVAVVVGVTWVPCFPVVWTMWALDNEILILSSHLCSAGSNSIPGDS